MPAPKPRLLGRLSPFLLDPLSPEYEVLTDTLPGFKATSLLAFEARQVHAALPDGSAIGAAVGRVILRTDRITWASRRRRGINASLAFDRPPHHHEARTHPHKHTARQFANSRPPGGEIRRGGEWPRGIS